MNELNSEAKGRSTRILDAAAELIIHYGYDKTSVSEIAAAAGISKGAVYLDFASKDALFEALLYRETITYAECWLAYLEADPQGGTIGSIYKAVLYALNQSPFMSAIVKQDSRIFGNYLRKPKNLFTAMESPSLRVDFLQEMQAVGAIRRDLDPAVVAHLMDMLSYGLVGVPVIKPAATIPPFDEVLAVIAEMMDRLLTPTEGNPGEAGKTVIRAIMVKARSQLAAMHAATKVSAG